MNKEEKGQRDLIIEILSECNKSELEGKGYDFYFVLRHKLDELNIKWNKLSIEQQNNLIKN